MPATRTRDKKRRQCWVKRKHTQHEAKQEARRLRSEKQEPRITAYECPTCGAWHVGKRSE